MRNCNDELREITNEIEIALSFLMSVNAQIKRCISPIGERISSRMMSCLRGLIATLMMPCI